MQGKFSSHQSQDGDVGPDNKKSLCCLLLVCDNERKRETLALVPANTNTSKQTLRSVHKNSLSVKYTPQKINRFYLFLLLLGCFDDSWIRLPGFTKVVEQSQGVDEEGHVDGGKGEMCMRSRKKTGFHL